MTGIDKPEAKPDRVENWLRLAGCKTVFRISSYTGEGIRDVIAYLDDGTDEKLCDSYDEKSKGATA